MEYSSNNDWQRVSLTSRAATHQDSKTHLLKLVAMGYVSRDTVMMAPANAVSTCLNAKFFG
jgi:hypothetical protein